MRTMAVQVEDGVGLQGGRGRGEWRRRGETALAVKTKTMEQAWQHKCCKRQLRRLRTCAFCAFHSVASPSGLMSPRPLLAPLTPIVHPVLFASFLISHPLLRSQSPPTCYPLCPPAPIFPDLLFLTPIRLRSLSLYLSLRLFHPVFKLRRQDGKCVYGY